MKWAFNVYTSKKIDADDPLVMKYAGIRNREIFQCPVCHESVFFRRAGGSHPNMFVHKRKDAETPFCTQRSSTNGININWAAQKTPFPLFLSKDGTSYHLNVFFRNVPSRYDVLKDEWLFIGNIDLKLQLKDLLNGELKKSISCPPSESTCTIAVNNKSKAMLELLNRWGSHIDYFYEGTGIFDYNTGKKIPVNESLFSGTDYIFISSNKQTKNLLFKELFDIVVESLGSLNVFGSLIDVIHIMIPEMVDEKISKFFTELRNPLSDKGAEPILLWPPSIKEYDVYNPIIDNSPCYIGVNPSIEREIVKISKEVSEVKDWSVTSIDRKTLKLYPDPEFTALKIDQGGFVSTVSLCIENATDLINNQSDSSTSIVDKTSCIVNTLNEANFILTDFLTYAAIHLKNGAVKYNEYKNGKIELKEPLESIEVYNYHWSRIISFECNETQSHAQDDCFPHVGLYSNVNVPVPDWFHNALLNYSTNDSVNARLVQRSCSSGYVSKELLSFLEKWRVKND